MPTVPVTTEHLLDEHDGVFYPAGEVVPATTGHILDEHDGVFYPAAETIPVTTGHILDAHDGILIVGPYIRYLSPLDPICVDAATAVMTFEIVTRLPDAVNLATVTVTVLFDGVTSETVYSAGAFQGPYVASSSTTHTVTGLEDIQAFSVERVGGWPPAAVILVTVTGQNTHIPPESIARGTWEWCTLPSGCGFLFFQRGYDPTLATHVYWTLPAQDCNPVITDPPRSGDPLFGCVILTVIGDIE